MSDRQWTQGQLDAIRARGGTLLVSAAAGSGKTAVLVQRVIERLTDPVSPSDADRLLIVTFTKAAAAEMQERIALSLSQALAADPGNQRLQRQQILLTKAHISTIHSFCSELARENFYKLDISPDFRILDDREMDLLRGDAAAQAMEEFYEEGGTEFLELVESFGTDRDDGRLVRTVNSLYDFIRSHPFPLRWLQEKEEMYQQAEAAGETPWGRCVLRFAEDALDYCISLIQDGLRGMQEEEKLDAAYREGYLDDLAGLEHIRSAVKSKDWDESLSLLNSFAFQRLKAARGFQEHPLKIRLSACRDEVKDTIAKLKKLFCADQQECAEDIRKLSVLVSCLFSLTKRFSDILEERKREKKAADFGDLEHWALRLLVEDTGEGIRKTEDAKELCEQFDEIMVDEYQDTNEAQDMLFRALSKEEGNLFLVGDVKQSIYSFRQAMPGIFLKRRASFLLYDRTRDEYPASVVLDRNFRSRKEVTDAVNFVFGQLMSEETGDVHYSGLECLQAGAEYPEGSGYATSLEIIDPSLTEEGAALESRMEILESRHIAGMIMQMMTDGFQVSDHGKQRPVLFRDFCILLRSSNQFAPEYVRELQKCGVPAWTDCSGGFFSAAEVAVMLSLLRVIDNPMQDIPLAAVLMSPIYGFTPDDMAKLRMGHGGTLYQALLAATKNGGKREQEFLEDMEQYRALAAAMPADRLINAVYDKTGYLSIVQAMPGGELRLSNLHLLLEHAKKYESSGYHGLSGFIRFIDRLQEQKGDLDSASEISESANVVRVMSIHKSKGLEFPICIVAGCSRKLPQDRGDALLHAELGLGVKLRDPELLCRYSTLPREAVALEKEREKMSEELRVLYVAMTRAREKLILVTTVKNLEKQLGALAAKIPAEPSIPPYVVRSASSISDWLLLCALRLQEGRILRDRALASEEIVLPKEGNPWEIHIVPPVLESAQKEEEKADTEILPDILLLEKIRKKIGYTYPYQALQKIPAKVAASVLASKEFEEQYAAMARPAFLGKNGLTPAERGTAMHTFLQFADFEKARNDVSAESRRLVEEGYLTEFEAGALELPKLEKFFESDLMTEILKSEFVQREYRFTVEIPAWKVDNGLPEEVRNSPIVLQGAVDCVFEEDGELIVVDYKTDRVKEASELREKYGPQLELYRSALEECLGKKVKECRLYSFALGEEIRKVKAEKVLDKPGECW